MARTNPETVADIEKLLFKAELRKLPILKQEMVNRVQVKVHKRLYCRSSCATLLHILFTTCLTRAGGPGRGMEQALHGRLRDSCSRSGEPQRLWDPQDSRPRALRVRR